MKKLKKILCILLCALFIQTPVLIMAQPVTVQAAKVKSGLRHEKGKYYYYVKGKKTVNAWKTIKVTSKGKTVSYRYYFGKDGAAYAGKKQFDGSDVLAVKKIGGKYYGFDSKAHMVKGIYFFNNKFYAFNTKTGVYDKNLTAKLRKASVYEKESTELKKLLGKPRKTEKSDSCFGNGWDISCYYDHFIVGYFRPSKGKEIVLGISGR